MVSKMFPHHSLVLVLEFCSTILQPYNNGLSLMILLLKQQNMLI